MKTCGLDISSTTDTKSLTLYLTGNGFNNLISTVGGLDNVEVPTPPAIFVCDGPKSKAILIAGIN